MTSQAAAQDVNVFCWTFRRPVLRVFMRSNVSTPWRFQFRLRTFLAIAVFAPFAISVMYALGVAKPYRFRELLFYSFVVLGGLVLRYPGAATGARLGNLARHALGWFSATIGAAITILVINGIGSRHEQVTQARNSALANCSMIKAASYRQRNGFKRVSHKIILDRTTILAACISLVLASART